MFAVGRQACRQSQSYPTAFPALSDDGDVGDAAAGVPSNPRISCCTAFN
jgi:hypothetical protein